MLGSRTDLVDEFLDGALVKKMITAPFGPYSDEWYKKAFKQGVLSVDLIKLRNKATKKLVDKYPFLNDALSGLDIKTAHERALLPDLNIQIFESAGEGGAPYAAYLSRDISRPFEIGLYEDTSNNPRNVMSSFPYCYWWKFDESVICDKDITVERSVDAVLAFFACMVIDAEPSMQLDKAVSEILLPGVHLTYDEKYATSKYVDYKLRWLKSSEEYTIEDLYRALSELDGGPDRNHDSVEKRIKRWRSGEVMPSLSLFQEFVFTFGSQSFRKYFSECETVGLFVAVQLIQKYRLALGGESILVNSDAFYIDRVHFWHDKIIKQYSGERATRAKELEHGIGDLN